MKKTIRMILCAAAFAVLGVSCQKEIGDIEPNTKETIEISVNGLMGEYAQVDGTKSELVNTIRVSWKGGETVYVFDGVKCLGSLVASLDGDEDRYALLSTNDTHTVAIPEDGTTKLTLVHSPLLTEAPSISGGTISISLADQNSVKAPFIAYATLDYNNEKSITNALVPFKFATSVIKVNCTGLKAGTAIDNATLSNVNTTCKLTISGTTAPTVAGDVNGTITRTRDEYFAASKVNAEGEAVFQIAVPELVEALGERVLKVAQGYKNFEDKNFTTKSLSVATSVNTVCQLVISLPAGALSGEFTVNAEGKKVYFSKGNLYADGGKALHFEANQYAFNSSNESSHVSHFTWSSTVEAAVGNTNSGDYLFCDESHKVSVDGGEAIYYALSKDEWRYLINKNGDENIRKDKFKCAVTVCGKTNCWVLAPDDFTGTIKASYGATAWASAEADGLVCLPAAGFRNGSNVINVGDDGFYWSSTASDSGSAFSVYFDSSNVYPVSIGSRGLGYSVRLITESN